MQSGNQVVEYRITAKPLEMGFINVMKHMRHLFPETKETEKISAHFADIQEEKLLSFQGKYNRVFGLTAWYRRNNAQVGDVVEVSKIRERLFDRYVFTLRKADRARGAAVTVPPKMRIVKRPVGEPINFRGLIYAPVNENGVIFLFGLVAKDLGIIVEGIQPQFPDAYGRRRINGRYSSVDIEFKFKSSDYERTYHRRKLLCDVLVCWEHDWTDPPREIEVIELKTKIRELKN